MVCKIVFTKEDEKKENKLSLYSTDCFHMTHKNCFLTHLFTLAKIGSPITCPVINCNKIVEEQEFFMYLGSKRKEYDKIVMKKFMEENPDIARCFCGNYI